MTGIAKRWTGSFQTRLALGAAAIVAALAAPWALTLAVPDLLPAPLVFGGALMLALALVVRLATRTARPIERLSRMARAMAAGDLRATVRRDNNGLAELTAALTDVRTQMRNRLADLEAEQRNLRAVLDGLTDAVLLLHGDRIVFANSATSRLFRAPALGWRDRNLDESGLPAAVRTAVTSALEISDPTTTESEPDPSGRTLRTSVLPLNPAEGRSRTLVVVSDTTQRTRLERMRRDFVANASHELKTPTAAIHLLADSAMHAAEDGDTAQALAFASRIEEESARLGRLVTDLLDLSRLESIPAPDAITDIREVVRNAVIGHTAAATERRLQLAADDTAVADEGVFAQADPTDIAVALDNLLDNAITYTETGSVCVRIDADPSEVRISVMDTGIGIPAEDVPRIFERFYRVDRARSRRSGGTGLGLALVRHVVERSSGTVEVVSEPGAGSTFTVTLPRA